MSPQKPIKMLSRQEEKELLRSGEDVLLSEFPNPERLGCPGTEILRTLAFSKPEPAVDRIGVATSIT